MKEAIYFSFNRKKIMDNFNDYNRIGNVYYPLKTNSNKNILELLKTLFGGKNGFLISNINHFKQLERIGVNPRQMCLINVLAETGTLRYLYNKGVRHFVFDNIESIMTFNQYANLGDCKIAIRLNTMEIFNEKIIHLGASKKDIMNMLKYLKGKCTDYGISFYLQKNIKEETLVLERVLGYIQNNFRNMEIKFISVAGIEDAKQLNLEYMESITREMNLEEIILEPGKHLVGNTMNMITRIIRVKEINEKVIVIIKNGLYSGFLDVLLYDEKFELYFETDKKEQIKLNYVKENHDDIEIYMCGGSSDSGDVIGTFYIENKYKKELKVNKKILVKNVGAYFEEFFMPYGGDINRIYIEEG